jgi:hypothetical protein
MVRVSSTVIIRLMTGNTEWGSGGVVRGFMTSSTTDSFMAKGKGKKVVVDTSSTPRKSSHIMAIGAIGRKISFMIRIFCGVIIIGMTIDALNT